MSHQKSIQQRIGEVFPGVHFNMTENDDHDMYISGDRSAYIMYGCDCEVAIMEDGEVFTQGFSHIGLEKATEIVRAKRDLYLQDLERAVPASVEALQNLTGLEWAFCDPGWVCLDNGGTIFPEDPKDGDSFWTCQFGEVFAISHTATLALLRALRKIEDSHDDN